MACSAGVSDSGTVASTLDAAMVEIFSSCDTEDEGFAPVSKLVDVISPFLQDDLDSLTQLNAILGYPESGDSLIDRKTFYQKMSLWVQEIEQANSADDVEKCRNTTQRDMESNLSEKSTSPQSRTISRFGQKFLKGFVEVGLNVSNSSTISTPDSPEEKGYQEKILELSHQNKQIHSELLHVRSQLLAAEEQIELFRDRYFKLQRKVQSEKQLNEQLEKERVESDDLRETYNITQRQLEKLEKILATAEKENASLKNKLGTFESEKRKLEAKIESLSENQLEYVQEIARVQTELAIKEQEIASLEEENVQLKNKLSEQEQSVQFYKNEAEKHKCEKLTLEKHLRSKQSKDFSGIFKNASNSPNNTTGDTQVPVPFSPSITHDKFNFFNYDSPYTRIKSAKITNSPSLMRMLSEPVTPMTDSPILYTCFETKKSIDSDESPKFFTNSVYLSTTSTPTDKEGCLSGVRPDVLKPSQVNSIKNGADGIGNLSPGEQGSSFKNEDSDYKTLPTLYVIENSIPDRPGIPAQDTSSEEDLSFKSPSPNVQGNHESLQTEISQAASKLVDGCRSFSDKEAGDIIKSNCSLNNHQNCTFVINKLKEEVGQLELSQEENNIKLNTFRLENKELHMQLSVNEDKKKILHTLCTQLEEEVTACKKQISELKIKIMESEECRRENEELRAKVESLKDENSEKFIKILNLIDDVQKMDSELRERSKSFEAKSDELKLEIRSLQNENEKLVDEMDVLKMENAKHWKNLKELRSAQKTAEELRAELTKMTEEKENLRNELDKAVGEMKKLIGIEEVKERCEKEIEILKSDLKEKENLLKNLEFEYTNDRKNFDMKLKDVCSKYDLLNSKYAECEKYYVEKVESFEASVSCLKASIKDKDTQLCCANNDLKQQKDLNNNLIKEIKNLENKIKCLEEVIDAKEKEIRKIKDDEVSCSNEIETLKKAREDLTENVDLLLDDLKKVEVKSSDIQKKYELKSKECNDLKIKHDRLLQENQKMTEKLQGLKKELNNVLDKSLREIQDKNDLYEKNKIMSEELSEIKIQLDTANGEKETLLTENNELREKCVNLQLDNSNSIRLIEDLNEHLKTARTDLYNLEVKMKIRDRDLREEIEVLRQQIKYLEEVNKELIDEGKMFECNSSSKLDCNKCVALKQTIQSLEMKLQKESEDTLKVQESVSSEDDEVKSVPQLTLPKEDFGLGKNETDEILYYVSVIKNQLVDKSNLLRNATSLLLRSWKPVLEQVIDFVDTLNNQNAENFPGTTSCDLVESLDLELQRLMHQVNLACELLENLSKIKIIKYELKDYEEEALVVNEAASSSTQSSSKENKPVLKKFTIRQTELLVTPSSPDSPSLEIGQEFAAESICENKNESRGGCELNNNCSLDSDGHLNEKNKEDDLDRLRSIYNDFIVDPSPSISIDFLRKLNLIEQYSGAASMSEEELEEKFLFLVLAFTIDKSTLRERKERQLINWIDAEDKFTKEVALLKKMMRPLGESKMDNEAVMNLYMQIEKLMEAYTQATVAAERMGGLKQEEKLMSSVNLIGNHVACLARKIESLTASQMSIRASVRTTQGNKIYNLPVEQLCLNCDKILKFNKYRRSERRTQEIHISESRTCKWKITLKYGILAIFLIMVVILINVERMCDSYRWCRELLFPIVTKKYPYGNPPI